MGLLKLCYQKDVTCISIYNELVQLYNHIFKILNCIECCFKIDLNSFKPVLIVRREMLALLLLFIRDHSELEILKT